MAQLSQIFQAALAKTLLTNEYPNSDLVHWWVLLGKALLTNEYP